MKLKNIFFYSNKNLEAIIQSIEPKIFDIKIEVSC